MIEQSESEIAEARAELALVTASAKKVLAAPVPPEFLFSAVEVERQKEISGIQQDYLVRLQELQRTGAASGTELLNLRLQLIASESMLKRSQQANELFNGAYGVASREEAAARQTVAEARMKSLETRLAQAHSDTAQRFPGEAIVAGNTLFKINLTGGSSLRLHTTEDRVEQIQAGQLVRFRAMNNPDRLAPLATGVVTEVALDRQLEVEQTQNSQSAPYSVKVQIDKEPYPLAVGASVEAEIVIARRPFWRLLFLKATGPR